MAISAREEVLLEAFRRLPPDAAVELSALAQRLAALAPGATIDWSDVNENLLDALKAQGHYEMKQGDYPSICGVCSRFYKPIKWPCPAAQALEGGE